MAIDTPTYPQYTNLALGDGLFDQLMATMKHHLRMEYDSQRIRGSEYAKVYLGSMESVLGNTTQYLLGILLIEQRKEQLELENRILDLDIIKLEYEIEHILPLIKLKTQAEVDLINAQISKINKEILFIDAKINTEIANVDGSGVTADSVVGRQTALLLAQKLGFAGDIESKVAKLHADYASVWQSVQEDETVPDLIFGGQTAAETAIDLALTTAVSIKAA